MAKMSIKLATKYHTDFDLSGTHITTSDFGQIQVSNFLEVLPTDKFHVSVFSEARCAPMVVPTFMDCKMFHRAFYVPMSAIYQPFEWMYTNKQDTSVFKGIPQITNANYVSYFTNISNGLVNVFVESDNVKPDFVIGTYYYVLTEKGRLMLKLLQSLGYSINWSTSDTTSMSILPLLAYMRVAYDYIYPSQYVDGLNLAQYFKCHTATEVNTLFGNFGVFLGNILTLLTLPYRQDYFTASWQNLNAPGTSVDSVVYTAPDSSAVDSTQTSVAVQSTNGPLSAYALKGLQRLYDFATRRNILGTRFADQLFGIFGIGSRNSDPDMSQFIGQAVQPVRVVDVTAMTGAENQELGELAGKAFINGSGKLFDFDSVDEFGYIITLSFIMPEIGYYQGRKRHTFRINRLDWLHPEFDMQMRAIRNDELFADYKSSADYSAGLSYGGHPTLRFSFAPNYSELKKGEHYITGDFRNDSLNENLKSYWLMRDLPVPSSSNPLALNAQFLLMQQHEFDKIFAQQYTLRIPFSLIENNAYSNVICLNNKPLVFTVVVNSITFAFVATYDKSTGVRFVGFRSDDDATHLSVLFGIDLSDTNTYYEVSAQATTSLGGVYNWLLFGKNYVLTSVVDGSAVKQSGATATGVNAYYYLCPKDTPTSSSAHGYRIVSYEGEFLLPYQDYIDHFYICHRFDIKANRPLAPVSEEFMIEDGGDRVSVDMNGNRIV